MKRTYKIALSLVISLGVVAPAFGQDSFPDVKDTHWAADAIKRLQLEKFIQGMPNGNYEGGRKVTRYEMASLVYAVYAKLVCFRDETALKIKDLEAKINKKASEPAAPASNDSDIRAALASLKGEVGTMKAWGSDINMLKKMSTAYQKELASLGVDVSDMKKQLNALSDRVTELEKKTANVIIGGDVNLWAFAGSKADGAVTGITQDGRTLAGNATGAGLDTLGVSHELGLSLKSGAQNDRAWGAEIVFGNMLNTVGDMASWATQLGTSYGNSAIAPGPQGNVFINSAWIAAPEIFGSTIGRQGLNLGQYILARPDITAFYSQDRWDNGNYLLDGLRTGTYSVGPVKASAFLGQINGLPNVGGAVQPINLNGLAISRMTGATVGFELGDVADLVANYVNFDGNTGATNRVDVWGVDGNFEIANFGLRGGYGKSLGKFGSSTTLDTDNSRVNVSANLFQGINVGYSRVERNYFAPGDWGRVGIFRNLTDVKSLSADATFAIGSKYKLMAGFADIDQLSANGEATTWNAGITTALTSLWDLSLGYEETDFKNGLLGTAPGSEAKFSTLGLNYKGGNGSLLRFFYQYSDVAGLIGAGGPIGAGHERRIQKGGFFGLQYGIKF